MLQLQDELSREESELTVDVQNRVEHGREEDASAGEAVDEVELTIRPDQQERSRNESHYWSVPSHTTSQKWRVRCFWWRG